jgi:hypothetical protein
MTDTTVIKESWTIYGHLNVFTCQLCRKNFYLTSRGAEDKFIPVGDAGQPKFCPFCGKDREL